MRTHYTVEEIKFIIRMIKAGDKEMKRTVEKKKEPYLV